MNQAVERNDRFLGILAEIATTISQSIDLPTLLDVNFRRVLALLGKEAGAIYLLEGGGRGLVLAVHEGLSQPFTEAVAHLRVGDLLTGHIALTGKPVYLADISEDRHTNLEMMEREGLQSFAGVPLLARGRVVGVLVIVGRKRYLLGENEMELLATVGKLLGVAIENARLYEETRRQALEWRSIVELGKEVVNNPDPDAVLNTVVAKAQKLLGTDVAFLALVLDDGRRLKMHRSAGLRTPEMLALETSGNAGVGGLVQRVGRPVIVSNYHTDPRLDNPPRGPVASEGLISFIAAPFSVGGEFLGILHVANRQPTRFSERDAELIGAFANEAAIAVQNGIRQRERETHRRRLQIILDSMPEGVLLLSAPDGRIDMLNAAGQALLGDILRLGEPLGPDIHWRSSEGQTLPSCDVPVVRSLQRGEIHTAIEIGIERPDGHRVPLLFSSAPLLGHDEQVTAAVGVFQDITRLKEVEHLKDEFLSLVSHELRGPLTGIKGMITSLLQPDIEWDTETSRHFLQHVERETEHLATMVENLLDMARLNDTVPHLDLERCHVADIIPSALDRVATLIDESRVRVQIPADLPDVNVDFHHMATVLANLLANAAKYSSEDALIEVTARHERDRVVVGVTDQGIGIPPNVLPQVFDKFYRGPAASGHRIVGAGLGLSICRGIVTAHEGQIWVHSEVGRGSTFSFSLPCQGVS